MKDVDVGAVGVPLLSAWTWTWYLLEGMRSWSSYEMTEAFKGISCGNENWRIMKTKAIKYSQSQSTKNFMSMYLIPSQTIGPMKPSVIHWLTAVLHYQSKEHLWEGWPIHRDICLRQYLGGRFCLCPVTRGRKDRGGRGSLAQPSSCVLSISLARLERCHKLHLSPTTNRKPPNERPPILWNFISQYYIIFHKPKPFEARV